MSTSRNSATFPTAAATKPSAGQAGPKNHRNAGYSYLHTAVHDHSRLAHSEILTDEKKETATAFWTRAQAFFTSCGITVERVLTDNGSCYRSRDWIDLLAAAEIAHKRTRPYRPQTNGKVEHPNRTLLDEWAYARPYRSEAERREAFLQWLHTYNHHCTPASFHAASRRQHVMPDPNPSSWGRYSHWITAPSATTVRPKRSTAESSSSPRTDKRASKPTVTPSTTSVRTF